MGTNTLRSLLKTNTSYLTDKNHGSKSYLIVFLKQKL